MAKKLKENLRWLQMMTEGYHDVEVKNFTTSFRDGLAFCAVIHRFHPELIDFKSLQKENIFYNNDLAFKAGDSLGINPLLEPADMVAMKTPDRMSIITYVSQYYNVLHNKPKNGGPDVAHKDAPAATVTFAGKPPGSSGEPDTKKQPTTPKASESGAKTRTLGDRCSICSNKVYLLERHVEEGKLYHRSCFRHSDLSPTNKVYTQSPFFSKKKDATAAKPGAAGLSTPPLGGVSVQGRALFSSSKDDVKHGVKRHAEDDGDTTGKRAEAQKSSFPGGRDSPRDVNKRLVNEASATSDTGACKMLGDKKIGYSQKAMPFSETHAPATQSSSEFLSVGKTAEDRKSPARQLPLVFQTAASADSRSASGSNLGGKAGNSVVGSATEKSSAPVAKPRSKLSTSTRENETKTVPKPSPRSGLAHIEESCVIGDSLLASKPRDFVITQKTVLHARPARESSPPPPPLPSSEPPFSPHTPQAASTPRPSPAQSAASKHGSPSASQDNMWRAHKAPSKDSVQKEEAMDVDTAVSKARSLYGEEPVAVMVVPTTQQEDKTMLKGLLKSLAGVRNANTSSDASTTVTPSRTTGAVTHLSAVSGGTSAGHRDAAHVDKGRGNKDKGFSLTDSQRDQAAGKSPLSVPLSKTSTATHKDAEARKASPRPASNGQNSVPVFKLSETVSVTVNTEKSEKGGKETGLAVSDQRVPLYKKKAANKTDKYGKSANEPGKKETVGNKERPKSAADILGGKVLSVPKQTNKYGKSANEPGKKENVGIKERPKSAADMLGGKGLSMPKQPAVSADTSNPPPFMQVKLRESGHSAVERQERTKSGGQLAERNGDSSKPSWQQEAERKMALVREGGFVDPETKKTVGKSADADKTPAKCLGAGQVAVQKPDPSHQKEVAQPPPRPPPVHKEEEVPKERAVDVKNRERKSSITGFLKGILKPGAENKDKTANASPPAKPERLLVKDEKASQEETKKADIPKRPERPSRKEKVHPGAKATPPALADSGKASTAAAAAPQLEESSGVKKKIGISKLDVGSPPSRTPPSPPSPTAQGRKKISVDIKFDFDSSMEASGRFPSSLGVEKTPPPARPPPPHRTPSPRTSMSPGRMSAIELQQQLLEIDSKLSELELRGRHLEDSIRSVAAEEEDDGLMMEWFQLVTEKNDLVRKECDLVYMSREQNLEDEQSQIESQLHYLLSKDEHNKSLEEKEEEEYLIHRKVEIVNQRNCIVDSMDEDRLRYEEEDQNIAQILKHKGFKEDSPKQGKKEKGTKVGSSKFYA